MYDKKFKLSITFFSQKTIIFTALQNADMNFYPQLRRGVLRLNKNSGVVSKVVKRPICHFEPCAEFVSVLFRNLNFLQVFDD